MCHNSYELIKNLKAEKYANVLRVMVDLGDLRHKRTALLFIDGRSEVK